MRVGVPEPVPEPQPGSGAGPAPPKSRQIAWILRGVLAAQVTGVILLAWLLRRYGHVHAGTSWLAAALLIAVVHPLVIAWDFIVTRIVSSPVPDAFRLSFAQMVRLFGAEYVASLRGFSYAHPFLAERRAPQPAGAAPGPPILFVHGYFCNRALWGPFMRRAAAAGFCPEAVTLLPGVSIERSIPLIDAALTDLCARTGAARVVIVAHSMGGLAVRVYLRHHGDARLFHLYTLGSPHAGTVMATFGAGEQVRQMRRGSPWLAALAARESPKRRARMTSVFSYHDNIVAPQLSAALPGTALWPRAGIGHVSLAYDRRLCAEILEDARARWNQAASESAAPRGTASSSFFV